MYLSFCQVPIRSFQAMVCIWVMQKKYGNKIAEQETEPSDISGISGF